MNLSTIRYIYGHGPVVYDDPGDQALKTLGKEHVDEKTIRVLSHRLNEDEKTALLAEGAEATDWIYTVIKEICKGEREND